MPKRRILFFLAGVIGVAVAGIADQCGERISGARTLMHETCVPSCPLIARC